MRRRLVPLLAAALLALPAAATQARGQPDRALAGAWRLAGSDDQGVYVGDATVAVDAGGRVTIALAFAYADGRRAGASFVGTLEGSVLRGRRDHGTVGIAGQLEQAQRSATAATYTLAAGGDVLEGRASRLRETLTRGREASLSRLLDVVVDHHAADVRRYAGRLRAAVRDAQDLPAAFAAGNPRVTAVVAQLDAFLAQRARAWLAEVPLEAEYEANRGFLEEFLAPEDDDPASVQRLQALLDRLQDANDRVRHEVHTTDLVDAHHPFSKGGHVIVAGDALASAPPDLAAALLAHEAAHLDQRHLPQILLAERASRLVAETLGDTPAARDLAALAVARFKRRTEFEADAAAIRSTQRAGFDPRVWLELFDGPAPRAVNPLDDHPMPAQRRARVEALLEASGRT